MCLPNVHTYICCSFCLFYCTFLSCVVFFFFFFFYIQFWMCYDGAHFYFRFWLDAIQLSWTELLRQRSLVGWVWLAGWLCLSECFVDSAIVYCGIKRNVRLQLRKLLAWIFRIYRVFTYCSSVYNIKINLVVLLLLLN